MIRLTIHLFLFVVVVSCQIVCSIIITAHTELMSLFLMSRQMYM